MSILALVLLLAHAAGPRDCVLPRVALQSPRDTAAYCAEEFVERNGYTDAVPGDRDMIAIEPRDRGATLVEALEFRRNKVARGPIAVCEDAAGFTVIFHTGDPHESRIARAVRLDRRYGGLTFLGGFVQLSRVATWPQCGPPPDWGSKRSQ